MSARVERGFGVLEAIVALILLAGTGAALFEWMANSTRSAAELEQRRAEARLTHLVLGWAEGLNPAAQPQGQWMDGTLQIRWRSEVVEAPRLVQVTQVTDTPRWLASLHRVEFEAEADGQRVRFELLRAGLTPNGPAVKGAQIAPP